MRTLADMHENVEELLRGNGRSAVKVIATREIEAGSLVGHGDYALRRPKSPKGPSPVAAGALAGGATIRQD
jgi:hypothetical protein